MENMDEIYAAEILFEDWLWLNWSPLECLEEFADDFNASVVSLASVLDSTPALVAYCLPLSPRVLDYVQDAMDNFSLPVETRLHTDTAFIPSYLGPVLDKASIHRVANRVQRKLLDPVYEPSV